MNKRTTTLWLLSVLGCGHTQAVQPPPAAAVAPQAAHASQEDIGDFMRDHFLIARFARDAVVDGDLEKLREPLRVFAEYRYDSVAAGGWMRGVAQLQTAARLTAEAEDLTLAATGVAAMARICGDCHREQGQSLSIIPAAIATVTPNSDRIEQRMLRHDWAAERLWEGLIAPSDQAWHAGAAALSHAPAPAPSMEGDVPAGFAGALAQLRELGTRAGAAHSRDERTNVYASALATCASCHFYQAAFKR